MFLFFFLPSLPLSLLLSPPPPILLRLLFSGPGSVPISTQLVHTAQQKKPGRAGLRNQRRKIVPRCTPYLGREAASKAPDVDWRSKSLPPLVLLLPSMPTSARHILLLANCRRLIEIELELAVQLPLARSSLLHTRVQRRTEEGERRHCSSFLLSCRHFKKKDEEKKLIVCLVFDRPCAAPSFSFFQSLHCVRGFCLSNPFLSLE